MDVRIKKDSRKTTGWITGVVDGTHYFTAKVYDEPSTFGIDDGCVSKLCICDTPHWDHKRVVFNYDRGEDVDELGADSEILRAILDNFPTPSGR